MRTVAATELLLLFPSVLFMTALMIRKVGPLSLEPASTAHQIAMWYAGRQWTLPAFLIVLPLAALILGGTTLMRGWRRDVATGVVAVATIVAAGVLGRVAMHMLAI